MINNKLILISVIAVTVWSISQEKFCTNKVTETHTKYRNETYTSNEIHNGRMVIAIRARTVPYITTKRLYRKICCPGYGGIDCLPICERICENGNCTAPEECTCNPGYEKFNNYSCIPICSAPHVCSCNKGFSMSNKNICEPICDITCTNGYCSGPNKCSCNSGFWMNEEGTCYPICDTVCINGFCSAPNVCSCNIGYNKDIINEDICYPVCEDKCINGQCIAPNTCECFDGHRPISKTNCIPIRVCDEYEGMCKPTCTAQCINSFCHSSNFCACNDGYKRISDNICEPVCVKPCINGFCLKPNECSCIQGYTKDDADPYKCVPDCENKCVNSKCIAPNECECFSGYEPISDIACQPSCTNCENGYCILPENCICNKHHEKNSHDICLPICTNCTNGICKGPEYCECFPGFVNIENASNCELAKFIPDPIRECMPICINGKCSYGNCTCLEGYSKLFDDDSSECITFCEKHCINGICTKDQKCICNQGYELQDDFKCIAQCSSECLNGHCDEPETCHCDTGYELSTINKYECIPICGLDGCTNGICIEPNKCLCPEGFRTSLDDKHICEMVPKTHFIPNITILCEVLILLLISGIIFTIFFIRNKRKVKKHKNMIVVWRTSESKPEVLVLL